MLRLLTWIADGCLVIAYWILLGRRRRPAKKVAVVSEQEMRKDDNFWLMDENDKLIQVDLQTWMASTMSEYDQGLAESVTWWQQFRADNPAASDKLCQLLFYEDQPDWVRSLPGEVLSKIRGLACMGMFHLQRADMRSRGVIDVEIHHDRAD